MVTGKMPPHLDLSRSKMIMSSPRINLRRATSYNHDKGPLSSTSSRFSFNHLLFASPPPSPSLPALIPRPRKSPTHPRPSRVLRALFWFIGLFLFFYIATFPFRRHAHIPILSTPHLAGQDEFEMVGQDGLPDFPTPIVVTDNRGKPKWTVSIPPSYDFPLSIKEYADMCSKCREVAARVRDLRHKSPIDQQMIMGHDVDDPYFVDVRDAEASGHLPGVAGNGWPTKEQGRDGDLVGENKDSLVEKPMCQSTLTFVLETADAGMGNTLMQLWAFYGLAKKQGRAFFIDDTRWAYGRYTDIFQPPPAPDCRPPPRHEMLPCPPRARHLVVSGATAKDMFSGTLGDHHADPKARNEDSMKQLFGLAHEGYRALFGLGKDDTHYVKSRIAELIAKARTGESSSHDGLVIGFHVRHGDRRPLEYQYKDSYVPINIFTERARDILDAKYNGTGPGGSDDVVAKKKSIMVVASDDPIVYEADEFADAKRAQEQIRLASKASIQNARTDRHVMHRFVDEAFGWEGGFFGAMFWNLGLSSISAANAATPATTEKTALAPSAETLRLRSYIGRAYMMDLAVLAGASDTLICTVSAMGCRLLAVMMGWERAMEESNWVNVDGDFGWTGLSW